MVLLVSAVPARPGIQAQSEQSERPRQLVPSLPCRSGARVASEERLRVQREAQAGVSGGKPAGNAALRGLRQADEKAGQRARLRRGMSASAQAQAAAQQPVDKIEPRRKK